MNSVRTAKTVVVLAASLISAVYAAPATATCPEGANRTLIEKLFYEGFSGGNMTVIDEVFHPEIHFEDPAFPPGLDGIKQLVEKNNRSFDHWHFTIHEMLCDGDRVVVRWNGNGMHAHSWMGEAPTGNTVNLNGIAIYEIENNKIIADWVVPDNLGFLIQIGVLGPMDLTK